MLRRWDGVAHCEIGKAHPLEYAAALRDFLRPDLERQKASPSSQNTGSAANNIKPFVRPPFVAETGTWTKVTRDAKVGD